MKEDTLKKGQEILEELTELRKIDKLLTGEHGRNVNVKFHQHFGDCKDYERVGLDKRHTPRFVKLLREIIQETEQDIKDL